MPHGPRALPSVCSPSSARSQSNTPELEPGCLSARQDLPPAASWSHLGKDIQTPYLVPEDPTGPDLACLN